MKYTNRVNTKRLTEQWDNGILKNCYVLIFSPTWGFNIVWCDEDGRTHSLKENSKVLTGYFIALAVYETEKQAREHFEDFVKWMD